MHAQVRLINSGFVTKSSIQMSRNIQNNKTGISPTMYTIMIIAVVAIVGFYFMSNASPSKTPTPSPSPTGTSSPSPSGSATIAGAKILQFNISLTKGGVNNGTYTYYTKNVDEISNSYKWGRAANFMMRIEYTNPSNDKTITVFDASQQKAWAYSNGQWQDISVGFASQFSALNAQWLGYWNSLKGWNGTGDWTYVANGATVRIYDIRVNPTLSGSLFGPN
jgi:hypothetical protein